MLWWVDQDNLLSSTAHSAIAESENELLISAATIWEIAIKVGIGKLTLSQPYREWMNRAINDLRASILPVSVDYADVQAKLAHHHGDPFDRMIVAQAIVERVAITSNDAIFDDYGVSRFW